MTTANVALIAILPISILLFATITARRALLATLIGSWLLLPNASLHIAGALSYDKVIAAGVASLSGALIFHCDRFLSIRPHWFDLPPALWCFVPLLSALSVGLSPAEGLVASFNQTMLWGVPYLLGRAFITSPKALRDLVLAIAIGGVLYAPLCLYEIRMSPQLHTAIYGFHQHSFSQTRRFGGWRPVVFMQHGLAVGMWMLGATLCSIWVWCRAGIDRLGAISMTFIVPVLFLTFLLVKSVGAWTLMVPGLSVMLLSRTRYLKLAMLAIVTATPSYMLIRVSGILPTHSIVEFASTFFPADNVASLETRLLQEDTLTRRASERLAVGWGPWGDFRVDSQGNQLVGATDGFWIIVLGRYGLVGLIAWSSLMLMPAALVIRLKPSNLDNAFTLQLAVALATVISLYAIDCLLNAMPNPIFAFVAGGLLSFVLKCERSRFGSGIRCDGELGLSAVAERGPVTAAKDCVPTLTRAHT